MPATYPERSTREFTRESDPGSFTGGGGRGGGGAEPAISLSPENRPDGDPGVGVNTRLAHLALAGRGRDRDTPEWPFDRLSRRRAHRSGTTVLGAAARKRRVRLARECRVPRKSANLGEEEGEGRRAAVQLSIDCVTREGLARGWRDARASGRGWHFDWRRPRTLALRNTCDPVGLRPADRSAPRLTRAGYWHHCREPTGAKLAASGSSFLAPRRNSDSKPPNSLPISLFSRLSPLDFEIGGTF